MALTYTTDIYESFVVQKRPIGSKLPGIIQGSLGQQEIADWLTAPIDKKLIELIQILFDLREQFDPNTADSEWLDFLALPCGFVEDYWDVRWTVDQKRWMLINSLSYIWPLRGTRQVLEDVLNNFDIEHDIWTPGRLQFPVRFGSKFGRPRMVFFVRLPHSIGRNTEKWNLAEKLTRQYSSLGIKKKVVYFLLYT